MVKKVKKIKVERIRKAGRLFQCPWADGMNCNQRRIMCDKGQFDMHCVMSILKVHNLNIGRNHEQVRKRAMEDFLIWLFDSNYMADDAGYLSPSTIIERFRDDEKEDIKSLNCGRR